MIHPGIDQPRSFELPDFYLGTDEPKGEYFRDGYTLYIDSHERLWIPAWGFLDTKKEDYTWQILTPTPLFVNLYDLDYVYTWDKANTLKLEMVRFGLLL